MTDNPDVSGASAKEEAKKLPLNPDTPGLGLTEGLWRTGVPVSVPDEGLGGISMDRRPSNGAAALITPVPGTVEDDDRLRRLEADAKLVQLARSHPEVLDRLRNTLIATVMPIVEAKITSRAMWNEALSQAGQPAPAPNPPVMEPEEIESLAAEVITRAFNRFRRHGLHKWDPQLGLSLTTWFYRDCLHQFANAVRAWSTDRRQLAPSLSCILGLDELSLSQLESRPAFAVSAGTDTETIVVSSITLELRLRDIEENLDRRTRRLVEECFVNERSLTEVARELGMSRQSAHRLIQRCRKVMIQVWGEEGQP